MQAARYGDFWKIRQHPALAAHHRITKGREDKEGNKQGNREGLNN
jgi:hypothetical protein